MRMSVLPKPKDQSHFFYYIVVALELIFIIKTFITVACCNFQFLLFYKLGIASFLFEKKGYLPIVFF